MSVFDMSIVQTENGFDTVYSRGCICRVKANCRIGVLEFYWENGRIECVDISNMVEISVSYNSQFGISVTEDGTMFFVQSWESGLYCISTSTGELIWHLKKRKAYEVFINKDQVVCRFFNSQAYSIDIKTGEILAIFKLSHDSIFVALSDEYILTGPKRGKFFVLNFAVVTLATIPEKKLNPYAYENFIVQKASISNSGILLAGVEYSNEMMTIARKNKSIQALLSNSHFSRKVEDISLECLFIKQAETS